MKNTDNENVNVVLVDTIQVSNFLLENIFNQCRCQCLFYHKPTSTFVIFVTLTDTNVNSNKNNTNDNKDDNDKNDENDEKKENEFEFENLYDFNNINNESDFNIWKNNVIKVNNGRLLIQMDINFDTKKEINSASIGFITINDDKCHIIGYESKRSLIIYDTLPTKIQEQEMAQKYINNKARSKNLHFHEYKMIRLTDIVQKWVNVF